MEQNRTEQNRTEQNNYTLKTCSQDRENSLYIENKIEQLKQIFPEIFCEEKVDVEKLKLVLGEENIDLNNERYHLNWAGKSKAYRTLQSPTYNTLTPCPQESVDFENTQNVFIEAENLEALKILQKSYAGQVKMIYIDPPYNTGNDSFIYPDKFSETRDEYAKRVGDVNQEGYLNREGAFQGAWRKNSKDNGHYHSNWLSMMLPRLHLAKTLLSDDGVIFISIDDNEQAQLKLLCDEVFGSENFVAELPWRGRGGGADDKNLLKNHEYILMYVKNKEEFTVGRKIKDNEIFPKFDVEKQRNYKIQLARKWGSNSKREDRPNLYYSVLDYDGNEIFPILPNGEDGCWRWKKERLEQAIKNKDVEFLKRNNGVVEIYEKIYQPLDGEYRTRLYSAWLQDEILEELEEVLSYEDARNTAYGTKQTQLLFNNKRYFDYPKPTPLIKVLMQIGSLNNNQIILDFFAGSGTTAHAVMQLNAEDGGNRRYICVQLPEATDEKSEAYKAGFATIADIAKERIRRAGQHIQNNLKENQKIDTGFKVFKLSESNFKQWQNPSFKGLSEEEQLKLFEKYQDVVKDNVRVEHMAVELILRLGFTLTDPLTYSDQIFWVNNQRGTRKTALLLESVDDNLLNKLLAESPVKVFALDKLFLNRDAFKTNMDCQLKDAGIAFETF
ncbi:site-specific DNA-methyltransferase [Basilea psittacipulmonis]|uniref:site-specific DNA-methyltransferase n=1 Tax=Basilea psittacipulmonis TaxID=1472345 RepID=UPI000987A738|nr:site-specific DNA-methyltransferase [Basilea psittacipulmonis]